MRTLILTACLFTLPFLTLRAQPSQRSTVFEGMAGYWTGMLEVRDSANAETFVRVAGDMRRSLDGTTLTMQISLYDGMRIAERFEAWVFDSTSLRLGVVQAGQNGTRRREYAVQGLQKVRTPSQWVIRRTTQDGPPFVRSTDIVQNDSLLILNEISDDMSTWRVESIMRLARHPRPAPVRFVLPGFEQARRVSVVGSFNGWQAGVTPMRWTRSGWTAELSLPPGEYQYKFSVDGQLRRDPLSSSLIGDGAGGYNAIQTVP